MLVTQLVQLGFFFHWLYSHLFRDAQQQHKNAASHILDRYRWPARKCRISEKQALYDPNICPG